MSKAFREIVTRGAIWLAVSATPVAAQEGTLTGVVVDSASGAPLHGATVRAIAEAGEIVAATRTDGRGRYRLPGLRGQRYDLVVARLGYELRRIPGVEPSPDTDDVVVRLAVRPVPLDQIVIVASRRAETTLDAAASVSVVNREAIEQQIALTPVDHVWTLAGIDMSSKGLIQRTYAIRGDRTANSGALKTMTDYRYASLPSLGFNVPYLIPPTQEDVSRIELMRGPGSALYGPNAERGLLLILTRSPFDTPRTSVSAAVGGRSLFVGGLRHAQVINEKLAFKISGEYTRGDDWVYIDTVEVRLREEEIARGADPDTLLIGRRDFEIDRAAGEVRVDWQPTLETAVTVTGGFAQAINNVDITSEVGGVQVRNWRNGFLQARLNYKSLFANVFLNGSNAGDTYVLRSGSQLVDNSRMIAGQVQHGAEIGDRFALLYGIDLEHTVPRTDSTINGRYEENDDLTEVGFYIHTNTALSSKLDLHIAARADYHSFLDNVVLSPRLGVLLKPTPTHTIRLTYNRAFRPPDPGDIFQDIEAANLFDLYSVRAVGRPFGYTFARDCAGLCMRSPFTPPELGGPTTYLPADATLAWDAIIQILQTQNPSVPSLPPPPPGQVGSVLRLLNSVSEEFELIGADEVVDAKPNERELTNVVELGYKGIFAGRWSAQVDVYRTVVSNLLSPSAIQTPNVFLEPTSLGEYLTSLGLPPSEVDNLVAAMAGVPAGTVSPREAPEPTDLLLYNFQGGSVTLWGIDVALLGDFSDYFYGGVTYSWVSDDFIPDATPFSAYVLNGPANKASATLGYRNRDVGLTMQIQGRGVSSFPVVTGVYGGTIDSYGVLDASASYRLPWVRNIVLTISGYNLTNNLHQEFIGAPEIGRLVVTRLSAAF